MVLNNRRWSFVSSNLFAGRNAGIAIQIRVCYEQLTQLTFYTQTAGYEQKKWEEEHLQQATLKFGAKDAKERHNKQVKSC